MIIVVLSKKDTDYMMKDVRKYYAYDVGMVTSFNYRKLVFQYIGKRYKSQSFFSKFFTEIFLSYH